ncbi:MAG: diaminopimelate epimerase [Bacteroidetes bacterium 4484_249]|nr:MAG: diaminopimelate epimerase [Bacteroidetes bacterium 4484_249]
MKIEFYKYHGTGNDFILIDNRKGDIELKKDQIAWLCNRRLGIGGDGLMFLLSSADFDFEMKYFNADGAEGTMCGNGGRCITAFANFLGIIKNKAHFMAIDGLHESEILSKNEQSVNVSLKMTDVDYIEKKNDYIFMNTGSPHYIKFVEDIEKVDVFNEGKRIRWDKRFQPGGTNVNFVEIKESKLIVRTFERGVEDVTLSCGTGVTASALAASMFQADDKNVFDIETYGGKLKVSFTKDKEKFTNIRLEGPAVKVFEGVVTVQ